MYKFNSESGDPVFKHKFKLAVGEPDGVIVCSGKNPVVVLVCCPSINNFVVAVVLSIIKGIESEEK